MEPTNPAEKEFDKSPFDFNFEAPQQQVQPRPSMPLQKSNTANIDSLLDLNFNVAPKQSDTSAAAQQQSNPFEVASNDFLSFVPPAPKP